MMKSFIVSFFICTCVVFAQAASPLVIPQVVNGPGWRSEIVLVNPTNGTLSGRLQFFDSQGKSPGAISYTIAPQATVHYEAASLKIGNAIGSLWILPDPGKTAPLGSSRLARIEAGTAVQETSIPATAGGRSFSFTGEVIGKASHVANAVRTGLAIANVSSNPVQVTAQFSPSLSTSFVIPANGQMSPFIDQLPGIESKLRAPYSGTVRLTSSADVAVVVLRGQWKSPNEFRTTVIPIGK
jgi:hypothetical protein